MGRPKGNINMMLIGIALIAVGLLFYVINFRWKFNSLVIFPILLLGIILLAYGLYVLYKYRPRPGELIVCPNCGHKYHLPAGTNTFRCPLCHKTVLVVTSDKTGNRKAFISPE